MIVVDSNILAFYLIEGKHTPAVHMLRDIDPEWIVPGFWRIELQSILWKYVRHGGMKTEKALELLDQAVRLFSINEVSPSADMVLRDALNWSITVYDAQYVSLARQYGIRCVTEDVPVQNACPDVAISLRDFIAGGQGGRRAREARAGYRVRKRRGRKGKEAQRH